jgi:microcystin degradation protein MlrC
MLAEGDDDPDGTLLRLVRSLLPKHARLVVTLDLHANVSDAMVEAADLVVGYRTNPHVDQRARGEEAALALRLMLAGEADPRTAFIRLPIAPPTVTLLTAEAPYGTLIDLGQRRLAEAGGRLLNVSIFGGFVFSDTAHNGLAILVAARDPKALGEARRLARDLALEVWAERHRFVRRLMPLAEAVDLALATDRAPRPTSIPRPARHATRRSRLRPRSWPWATVPSPGGSASTPAGGCTSAPRRRCDSAG